MGFIDSYKHLEKLCGEVLNDERKISAYIDEMINKPRGSYIVSGWDEDLKQLKHYRHIRNKIAHEPGCYEENMCDIGDTEWLDNFYYRIMNQTDPLTLYNKSTRSRSVAKRSETRRTVQANYIYTSHRQKDKKPFGCIALLLIIALIAILLFVLKNYLN